MGISDVSLLNFVVSDGATMIATRFVRPESEAAATLYYAEGASFDRLQPQQQQHAQDPQQQMGSGLSAANGTSNSSSSSVAEGKVSSCGGCPAAVAASTQEGGAVGTQELVGSSVLCEASYGISYSERGASIAFVASEPITGSTTDWVSADVQLLELWQAVAALLCSNMGVSGACKSRTLVDGCTRHTAADSLRAAVAGSCCVIVSSIDVAGTRKAGR
jgi:hypothetical protein